MRNQPEFVTNTVHHCDNTEGVWQWLRAQRLLLVTFSSLAVAKQHGFVPFRSASRVNAQRTLPTRHHLSGNFFFLFKLPLTVNSSFLSSFETSAPFATSMSRFLFLPAPLHFKGNLTRRRRRLDSETCLFFPYSGIDDDSSSLMQQKLERQVRQGRLCHTSYTHTPSFVISSLHKWQ